MGAKIYFGTDGWQARMDGDFTAENVRVVAQGIATYLKRSGRGPRGAVVGYDTRRNSRNFALHAASVIAGNYIPVMMLNRPAPTPVAAFQVMHRKTGGAIVITACHNPPVYNGVVFIPEYAGPALPNYTNRIELFIEETTPDDVRGIALTQMREKIQTLDPSDEYMRHLKRLIDVKTMRRAGLEIVYDAMHGAGTGYLDTLLSECGCEVLTINTDHDPDFGGVAPDPREPSLAELCNRVASTRSTLGLATDGDADRAAACDEKGGYLSPSKIFGILYLHLIKSGRGGNVVRTIATTHLVDAIAQRYGYETIEVPVGFGHVAKELRRGAALGGDESGGFSTCNHVSERDGIYSALLLAEAVSASGEALSEMIEDVHEQFGELHSGHVDIPFHKGDRQIVEKQIANLQPNEIAGVRVKKRAAADGVKFYLEDGSWLLLRTWETEPNLRVYYESVDKKMATQLLREGEEMVAASYPY